MAAPQSAPYAPSHGQRHWAPGQSVGEAISKEHFLRPQLRPAMDGVSHTAEPYQEDQENRCECHVEGGARPATSELHNLIPASPRPPRDPPVLERDRAIRQTALGRADAAGCLFKGVPGRQSGLLRRRHRLRPHHGQSAPARRGLRAEGRRPPLPPRACTPHCAERRWPLTPDPRTAVARRAPDSGRFRGHRRGGRPVARR